MSAARTNAVTRHTNTMPAPSAAAVATKAVPIVPTAIIIVDRRITAPVDRWPTTAPPRRRRALAGTRDSRPRGSQPLHLARDGDLGLATAHTLACILPLPRLSNELHDLGFPKVPFMQAEPAKHVHHPPLRYVGR